MHHPLSPAQPASGPFQVVLDTQCVLDWRLFSNPRCAVWDDSHAAGAWAWQATPDMREELRFVLAREFVTRWPVSAEDVLGWFDVHARLVTSPAAAPAKGLICTDRSDQKFIDLAVHLKADWLISRDRAVLKLARRAHQLHGLRIATPEAWTDALDGLRTP